MNPSKPAGRGTVLLFREAEGYRPGASVASAFDPAAGALAGTGYAVPEGALPHFSKAQDLWSPFVMNEARKVFGAAVDEVGDGNPKRFVEAWLEVTPEADLHDFSAALSRRSAIAGEWDLLPQDHAAILMPSSWEAPLAWDSDQGGRRPCATSSASSRGCLCRRPWGCLAWRFPRGSPRVSPPASRSSRAGSGRTDASSWGRPSRRRWGG